MQDRTGQINQLVKLVENNHSQLAKTKFTSKDWDEKIVLLSSAYDLVMTAKTAAAPDSEKIFHTIIQYFEVLKALQKIHPGKIKGDHMAIMTETVKISHQLHQDHTIVKKLEDQKKAAEQVQIDQKISNLKNIHENYVSKIKHEEIVGKKNTEIEVRKKFSTQIELLISMNNVDLKGVSLCFQMEQEGLGLAQPGLAANPFTATANFANAAQQNPSPTVQPQAQPQPQPANQSSSANSAPSSPVATRMNTPGKSK